MKIKQDFVTNSSSVNFILCVPKNINVEKLVERNWENITKIRENLNKQVVINAIKIILDKKFIHEQDEKFLEEWNLCMWDIFYAFEKEGNCILNYNETGMGADGWVQILYTKELKDITDSIERNFNEN